MILKIFYVILTCEKYIDTRVKWQKESWLNKIDVNDYVYLDKPVGEEIYTNVSKKYVEFLKNFDRVNEYQWFFFCDDDTFVFPIKLNFLLGRHDHRFTKMIGYNFGEFKIEGTEMITGCCSGGGGIALSNPLVNNVKKYVSDDNCIVTGESDTSLAVWCKLSTPDYTIVHEGDYFRPHNLGHEFNRGIDFSKCVTFHYCTDLDFNILKEQL